MRGLQERLKALSSARLHGMGRGVEKESLRVTARGELARTPHPHALGSALTHPHITTDFSESQLELITGVHPDAEAAELELTQVHQAVYRALGELMAGPVHALALQTFTPESWAKKKRLT